MNRKKKDPASTQDLFSELQQAKSLKNKYSKQLKSSIKQNNSIIKKVKSTSNIIINTDNNNNGTNLNSNNSKLTIRKQKSLIQLSRNLNERIKIDKDAKIKLQQLGDEYASKKQKIQKRIEQVKKRNINRMKDLNDFQTKYLNKLNAEYMKDKQKQQTLLYEYEYVLKQEGRVRQTESYRRAVQAEDWQQILKEKKKLQTMVRQYTRKQQLLLKQQNPQHFYRLKKQAENKLNEEKTLAATVERVVLPKVKGDAKQIGNQYLQYAKKLKDMPKDTKIKARTLDINLKCIDYSSDIMNKIARNTSDLSRYRVYQSPVTVRDTTKTKDKAESGTFKMPMFEVKQDEQTKKHLKQIRNNLKQMQGSK